MQGKKVKKGPIDLIFCQVYMIVQTNFNNASILRISKVTIFPPVPFRFEKGNKAMDRSPFVLFKPPDVSGAPIGVPAQKKFGGQ